MLQIFDEIELPSSSTYEVCAEILKRYPGYQYQVTGDATGRNRSAMTIGNLNHYRIIKEELRLFDYEILVPTSNLAVRDSRVLVNSVLATGNVRITQNCEKTINDLFNAQVDGEGSLVKDVKNGMHLFDSFRYLVHTSFGEWITNPGRYYCLPNN